MVPTPPAPSRTPLRAPTAPSAPAPLSSVSSSSLTSSQKIRALLEELPEGMVGRIRIGGPQAVSDARLATGIGALDALLAGGFPRGSLSEITGPLGTGRTALALALLAETTRAGELAAWVEAGDAFDPGAAEDAGVGLTRVLWTRAPALPPALRCTERLLEARGFALVVLDPGDRALAGERVELDPASLQRLRRRAASSGTALVCVGGERRLGRFASLVLRTRESRPRFDAQPDWLEGVSTCFALERSRTGPAGGSVSLFLAAPTGPATDAPAPSGPEMEGPPLARGLSVRAGPPGRRGAASSA